MVCLQIINKFHKFSIFVKKMLAKCEQIVYNVFTNKKHIKKREEINMLKNLKNKMNNKGFSLVELIVVIAIMVILIAMLVPNVVGYIKKANWATEQNGASTVFSAAQTYVTDVYASTGSVISPSVDDLVSANLLTKTPNISYTIELDSTGVAAVDKVTWSSANAPSDITTPQYPAAASN